MWNVIFDGNFILERIFLFCFAVFKQLYMKLGPLVLVEDMLDINFPRSLDCHAVS